MANRNIDTSIRKPRRAKGTPVFYQRNVVAVGTILFGGLCWYLYDKAESISKFFTKNSAQLENEPVNKLSKTKKIILSDDDDFKTPKPVKKLAKIFTKPDASQSQPQTKRKYVRRGRPPKKNPLQKTIEDTFKKADVNGEHLQMAVAMSMAVQDEPIAVVCDGDDDCKEDDKYVPVFPDTQEVRENARKTLEQYGFKTSRSGKSEVNSTKNVEASKRKKKSRYHYIKPILFLRTNEDREEMINSKVAQILNESLVSESKPQIDDIPVHSKILHQYHCTINQTIYRNNLPVTELQNRDYYVEKLNLPPSEHVCGSFLKRWEDIPGRELSPSRFKEIERKGASNQSSEGGNNAKPFQNEENVDVSESTSLSQDNPDYKHTRPPNPDNIVLIGGLNQNDSFCKIEENSAMIPNCTNSIDIKRESGEDLTYNAHSLVCETPVIPEIKIKPEVSQIHSDFSLRTLSQSSIRRSPSPDLFDSDDELPAPKDVFKEEVIDIFDVPTDSDEDEASRGLEELNSQHKKCTYTQKSVKTFEFDQQNFDSNKDEGIKRKSRVLMDSNEKTEGIKTEIDSNKINLLDEHEHSNQIFDTKIKKKEKGINILDGNLNPNELFETDTKKNEKESNPLCAKQENIFSNESQRRNPKKILSEQSPEIVEDRAQPQHSTEHSTKRKILQTNPSHQNPMEDTSLTKGKGTTSVNLVFQRHSSQHDIQKIPEPAQKRSKKLDNIFSASLISNLNTSSTDYSDDRDFSDSEIIEAGNGICHYESFCENEEMLNMDRALDVESDSEEEYCKESLNNRFIRENSNKDNKTKKHNQTIHEKLSSNVVELDSSSEDECNKESFYNNQSIHDSQMKAQRKKHNSTRKCIQEVQQSNIVDKFIRKEFEKEKYLENQGDEEYKKDDHNFPNKKGTFDNNEFVSRNEDIFTGNKEGFFNDSRLDPVITLTFNTDRNEEAFRKVQFNAGISSAEQDENVLCIKTDFKKISKNIAETPNRYVDTKKKKPKILRKKLQVSLRQEDDEELEEQKDSLMEKRMSDVSEGMDCSEIISNLNQNSDSSREDKDYHRYSEDFPSEKSEIEKGNVYSSKRKENCKTFSKKETEQQNLLHEFKEIPNFTTNSGSIRDTTSIKKTHTSVNTKSSNLKNFDSTQDAIYPNKGFKISQNSDVSTSTSSLNSFDTPQDCTNKLQFSEDSILQQKIHPRSNEDISITENDSKKIRRSRKSTPKSKFDSPFLTNISYNSDRTSLNITAHINDILNNHDATFMKDALDSTASFLNAQNLEGADELEVSQTKFGEDKPAVIEDIDDITKESTSTEDNETHLEDFDKEIKEANVKYDKIFLEKPTKKKKSAKEETQQLKLTEDNGTVNNLESLDQTSKASTKSKYSHCKVMKMSTNNDEINIFDKSCLEGVKLTGYDRSNEDCIDLNVVRKSNSNRKTTDDKKIHVIVTDSVVQSLNKREEDEVIDLSQDSDDSESASTKYSNQDQYDSDNPKNLSQEIDVFKSNYKLKRLERLSSSGSDSKDNCSPEKTLRKDSHLKKLKSTNNTKYSLETHSDSERNEKHRSFKQRKALPEFKKKSENTSGDEMSEVNDVSTNTKSVKSAPATKFMSTKITIDEDETLKGTKECSSHLHSERISNSSVRNNPSKITLEEGEPYKNIKAQSTNVSNAPDSEIILENTKTNIFLKKNSKGKNVVGTTSPAIGKSSKCAKGDTLKYIRNALDEDQALDNIEKSLVDLKRNPTSIIVTNQYLEHSTTDEKRIACATNTFKKKRSISPITVTAGAGEETVVKPSTQCSKSPTHALNVEDTPKIICEEINASSAEQSKSTKSVFSKRKSSEIVTVEGCLLPTDNYVAGNTSVFRRYKSNLDSGKTFKGTTGCSTRFLSADGENVGKSIACVKARHINKKLKRSISPTNITAAGAGEGIEKQSSDIIKSSIHTLDIEDTKKDDTPSIATKSAKSNLKEKSTEKSQLSAAVIQIYPSISDEVAIKDADLSARRNSVRTKSANSHFPHKTTSEKDVTGTLGNKTLSKPEPCSSNLPKTSTASNEQLSPTPNNLITEKELRKEHLLKGNKKPTSRLILRSASFKTIAGSTTTKRKSSECDFPKSMLRKKPRKIERVSSSESEPCGSKQINELKSKISRRKTNDIKNKAGCTDSKSVDSTTPTFKDQLVQDLSKESDSEKQIGKWKSKSKEIQLEDKPSDSDHEQECDDLRIRNTKDEILQEFENRVARSKSKSKIIEVSSDADDDVSRIPITQESIEELESSQNSVTKVYNFENRVEKIKSRSEKIQSCEQDCEDSRIFTLGDCSNKHKSSKVSKNLSNDDLKISDQFDTKSKSSFQKHDSLDSTISQDSIYISDEELNYSSMNSPARNKGALDFGDYATVSKKKNMFGKSKNHNQYLMALDTSAESRQKDVNYKNINQEEGTDEKNNVYHTIEFEDLIYKRILTPTSHEETRIETPKNNSSTTLLPSTMSQESICISDEELNIDNSFNKYPLLKSNNNKDLTSVSNDNEGVSLNMSKHQFSKRQLKKKSRFQISDTESSGEETETSMIQFPEGSEVRFTDLIKRFEFEIALKENYIRENKGFSAGSQSDVDVEILEVPETNSLDEAQIRKTSFPDNKVHTSETNFDDKFKEADSFHDEIFDFGNQIGQDDGVQLLEMNFSRDQVDHYNKIGDTILETNFDHNGTDVGNYSLNPMYDNIEDYYPPEPPVDEHVVNKTDDNITRNYGIDSIKKIPDEKIVHRRLGELRSTPRGSLKKKSNSFFEDTLANLLEQTNVITAIDQKIANFDKNPGMKGASLNYNLDNQRETISKNQRLESQKNLSNKSDFNKNNSPPNNQNINEFSEEINQILTPEKYGYVSVAEGIVTPNGRVIMKTRNVTPMPDFDAMETPKIHEELSKFGMKRLRRNRGVELLKYIYESTHPIVDSRKLGEGGGNCREVVPRRLVLGGEGEGRRCEDVMESRLHAERIECVGDSINLGESEIDMIFERKCSKRILSCQLPLHIAWHNLLCANPDVRENILLYEPLQVEVLYSMLKEQGFKYNIQDLITFLDKKCITIRMN